MPEKEAAAHGLSFLSFAWLVLSVPLKWIWHRQTKQAEAIEALKEKQSAHELDVAQNHFRKDEIKDIINGTLKPVRESMDRIESKVDRFTERREGGGK